MVLFYGIFRCHSWPDPDVIDNYELNSIFKPFSAIACNYIIACFMCNVFFQDFHQRNFFCFMERIPATSAPSCQKVLTSTQIRPGIGKRWPSMEKVKYRRAKKSCPTLQLKYKSLEEQNDQSLFNCCLCFLEHIVNKVSSINQNKNLLAHITNNFLFFYSCLTTLYFFG